MMLQTNEIAIAAVLAACLIGLLIIIVMLLLALRREKKSALVLRERFGKVIDADAEAERVGDLLDHKRETLASVETDLRSLESQYKNIRGSEAIVSSLETQAVSLSSQIEQIRSEYKNKKSVFDSLVKEIAIFDEKLSFAEMGVYEPHFDFTDSDAYKAAIEAVRLEQKSLASSNSAVLCRTQWSVDGSEAKGRTMTNRAIKLTLRAFNGECDAAIANARWNNVGAMEKRIDRANDQINKLNASNHVIITDRYAGLKKKELFLTHEYREKLKAEKEERAEAARASREEQKLIRDMDAAEEAEARYQKLLAKARAEAAKASGARLEALSDQVKMLEDDLAEAHAKVERAQAMAERTRSGYVYIISNIGSFGKDVVKIGLTRRLDPLDRVRELGDASVPFIFDTHAIIYSDNAPSLERALHAEFEKTRVNAQNFRKEFFRASIDDVESAVKRLAPDATFFKDIEAQEYQETLSRRQLALADAASSNATVFPATI